MIPLAQSGESGGITHLVLGRSDDDSADVSAILHESQIMEVLQQLDQELVGLTSVKTRIREIAALLLIDRLRRRLELMARSPSLHMYFTGGSGTGKTTVAMRIATSNDLIYPRKPMCLIDLMRQHKAQPGVVTVL